MSEEEQKQSNIDPEEIAKFLEEQQAQAPEVEQRVEVSRDKIMDKNLPSNEDLLQAGIKKFDKVTISEQEKENYLECVLFDKPLNLTVSMYKGKINLTFKSRNQFEQDAIFAALKSRGFTNLESASKEVVVGYIETLRIYVMLVSLLKIGDSTWEFYVNVNDCEALDQAANKLIEGEKAYKAKRLSNIKWQTLLNGYNIFSRKEQLLTSNVINEDF